jgi:tetratricopeptide (TPR) repeat protein
MFWEARKLWSSSKQKSEQKHHEAAEFARKHDFLPEATLAEASLLDRQKKYEEAKARVSGVLDDPNLRLRPLCIFLLGSVAYNQKRYKAATVHFTEAIDSGLSRPEFAWVNMGLAFTSEGNFDEAIECYRKALETPGLDNPGDAWNRMGLAFAGERNFDKAIECYKKALAAPGYDTPGYTWNNTSVRL